MGKGNKAEMLIAVCAVISSVIAVFIAWDQGRVMRSQEKADVWPIVQVTHQTETSNRNTYVFYVENAGVGPALIEDYLIRIPGREDTKNFRDMVEYFMPPEDLGVPLYANATLSGRVLRQGGDLEPIGATWEPGPEIGQKLQARIDAFVRGDFQPPETFICYCSLLDDCWVTTTLPDHQRPIEVGTCAQLTEVADKLFPKTKIPPQTEESIQ